MTRTATLALLLSLPAAALTAPTTGTKIDDRIPEFTAPGMVLTGAEPRPVTLISQKTKHPTAYLFVGTTCPATKGYLERMKELEQAYGKKGVDFVFIYPNRTDTSEAKKNFHREAGFASPMVDDTDARIAKLLAATRTSEVLIADKNGTLLYRGAIDDNPGDARKATKRYVRDALDAQKAGKPVEIATTEVRA